MKKLSDAMSRPEGIGAPPETDSWKLRMLVDWFDARDDHRGYTGKRYVQSDLRRIADKIETTESRLSDMEAVIQGARLVAEGTGMSVGTTALRMRILSKALATLNQQPEGEQQSGRLRGTPLDEDGAIRFDKQHPEEPADEA